MKIIYEDSSIIVVDKPCGLIVNRSDTTSEITLQDQLDDLNYDFSSLDDEAGDFTDRSGIVHRLDKDTSGLLVIAKTSKDFAHLQKQFKDRVVKKEYLAVLMGNVADEYIEIEAPLGRNPSNPLKFAVTTLGKDAKTTISKICNFKKDEVEYSYVKVFPQTGRTHQIRVHTCAFSHPVAMDKIYCTRKQLETSARHFDRMMLHAHVLTFKHPSESREISFTSDLPVEFTMLPSMSE